MNDDNPLFRTAADFVNNTSRHIFLTGKAGTGKTTFLKYIKENTPKKCVVVAPTGVAAINAGGVTMHSLFQLPLGPYVPVAQRFSDNGYTDKLKLFKNIRLSEEKRELLRDLELIIIDEVSMVRCDTLDAMDAILRYFRKRNDQPFGGVQVLYIGDLFQLPPVMPEQEWSVLREYYKSPFFFHSKVVEQAQPVYIALKKIYRQNEARFIELLNRVRNAEVNDSDIGILDSRYQVAPVSGENYITLTTHNYKADRINAEELKKLPGKLYEFKGTVEGDFPHKTLPTEVTLQLKKGAQVMFIRNDKSEEHKYFNGKIATVKMVTDDAIIVSFADSGDELLLEKETWDNIRYSYNQPEERIDEEKLGSFTQYPVRLAWAITIHKSQGLTFQHAIIDAGDSFAPGQVYVALSRCTSLDGLVLHSRILPGNISTNGEVLAFATREAVNEELSLLLQQEKIEYQNAQLTGTFDLQKLADVLRTYWQSIPARKLPNVAEALSYAKKMLNDVEEQQKIALKFQQQINILLKADEQEKLRERVVRAIEYFSGKLAEELLTPLDHHIAAVKNAPKVKKYLKQVRQLKLGVVNKMNAIQQVQYGEVVFNPSAVKISVPDEIVPQVSGKPEKGSSLSETLALFKSGLKVSEIASQRNLALSTIEGHLSLLVKSGEVAIHDFIEEDKVESILAVIRETQAASMQSVKQKLGDGVSYGEIRAVMNHLQFLEKQEVKE